MKRTAGVTTSIVILASLATAVGYTAADEPRTEQLTFSDGVSSSSTMSVG